MHLQIVAHNQHELSTVVYAWCNWINNPPPLPILWPLTNRAACFFPIQTEVIPTGRRLSLSHGPYQGPGASRHAPKKYPTHSPTPRHGENTGLPATQISDSKWYLTDKQKHY
jgi:hypothetical protein